MKQDVKFNYFALYPLKPTENCKTEEYLAVPPTLCSVGNL